TEHGLPRARALLLVEEVETLPHLDQAADRELRDGCRRDARGVGEGDVRGQVGLEQVVDARADGLDPPQVRRYFGEALRHVERDRDLRVAPDLEFAVVQRVARTGNVVREHAEVRRRLDPEV